MSGGITIMGIGFATLAVVTIEGFILGGPAGAIAVTIPTAYLVAGPIYQGYSFFEEGYNLYYAE
jgi:hypothetical protein